MPAKENKFLWVCLGVALGIGLAVRAPYYIQYDFPMGDGGMFAQIVDDIRIADYAYPDVISYNFRGIPFAYPPLGFYLAALATDVLGVRTLDTMTGFPLIFNILTIGVFVLLAGRLLEKKGAVLLAAIIFPFLFRSYGFVIVGGGLTRSPGFFFGLCALYTATRLRSLSDYRFGGLTLLFLSAAALTHPEWGITTFVSVSLLILLQRSFREEALKHKLIALATLGAAAAVLTAPWWLTVLVHHGAAPFLAASQTSGWQPRSDFFYALDTLKISGGHLLLLPLLGIIVCIARKQWFFLIWPLAVFLTTPRHAPTPLTVPYTLLSAVGLHGVTTFIIEGISSFQRIPGKQLWEGLKMDGPVGTNLAVVLALGCVAYLTMGRVQWMPLNSLRPVSAGERQAMHWIKKNTPPKANFVALSAVARSWQGDVAAEWFPYLAKRRNLTTVQGLEWVPGGALGEADREVGAIKDVQNNGATDRAVDTTYQDVDYVAFFSDGSNFSESFALRYEGFATSNAYRRVYENACCLVLKKASAKEKKTETMEESFGRSKIRK